MNTLPMQRDVPLSLYTTLEIGGPAQYFIDVADEAALGEALGWAFRQGTDVFLLGGGSNIVAADEGVTGLVIHNRLRGLSWNKRGSQTFVTVQAGEPWDELVRATVEEGWAGLECLSGIPGTVGATPIQNVGAYGQEVSSSIVSVRALGRRDGLVHELSARECAFAYRSSRFKRSPADFVVFAVTFALEKRRSRITYEELRRTLGAEEISVAKAREAVLALRKKKSMVLDPTDANHRSAGSFFLNPVLDANALSDFERRAVIGGLCDRPEDVPRFPAGPNAFKVPAAWLIERSGFHKGSGTGNVGLSTNHALALVNRGGASAAELLQLAQTIVDGVQRRCGVWLTPEPVFVGFRDPPLRLKAAL